MKHSIIPIIVAITLSTSNIGNTVLAAGSSNIAVNLYKKWDYKVAEQLQSERKDAYSLIKAEGIKWKDWKMATNPDVEIIKTWKQDALTDGNIMLQAAAIRTWVPACKKNYEQKKMVDAKLEKKYGAKLNEINKENNWYIAMKQYSQILNQANSAYKDLDIVETSHRGVGQNVVGFPWKILKAAVDYHNKSNHTFIKSNHLPLGTALGLVESGRETSDDTKFEHKVFCANLAKEGNKYLSQFPVILQSYKAKSINWPQYLDRYNRGQGGIINKNKVMISTETKKVNVEFEKFKVSPASKYGKYASIEYANNEKITLFDDGYELVKISDKNITLRSTNTVSQTYGCKRGKISGIKENGDFKYHQVGCKISTKRYTNTINLEVEELPAGFEWEKGKEYIFYASVQSDEKKEKKNGKDTDYTRNFKANLRHLVIKSI